ncbi:hypothetical protein [Chromobacterium sp. CV08]|uniref:hypothetical protein n=1 Tax=Chromobacterium sp. CV08 TaxID=3133274 RepID=UPI003DA85812
MRHDAIFCLGLFWNQLPSFDANQAPKLLGVLSGLNKSISYSDAVYCLTILTCWQQVICQLRNVEHLKRVGSAGNCGLYLKFISDCDHLAWGGIQKKLRAVDNYQTAIQFDTMPYRVCSCWAWAAGGQEAEQRRALCPVDHAWGGRRDGYACHSDLRGRSIQLTGASCGQDAPVGAGCG